MFKWGPRNSAGTCQTERGLSAPIFPSHSLRATRVNARRSLALALLTFASLAVAAWAGGWPSWTLAVGAAAVVGGLWVLPGTGGRRSVGALVLVVGVMAGFAAEWDLNRFSSRWPERLERWEARVQESLVQELDQTLRSGEAAAEQLARTWDGPAEIGAPSLPQGLLRPGVDAVAVFGPEGTLLAWDGIHQGPFPRGPRAGQERYLYREGALFGYLYITHPLAEGRGTVVSASLLRADLPPGLDEGLTDFTSMFHRRHGARIRISRADRVEGQSVWDLRWEDQVLLSVTMDPLSEAAALEARSTGWKRGVAVGLLVAWLLLLAGGRRVPGGMAILGVGLLGLLSLLPLGRLLGVPGLFSPTGFLLPLTGGGTLGDLLVLGGALALLLGAVSPDRLPRIPPWLAALGAAGIAAGLLGLLSRGASRELLGLGEQGWVAFQGTAGILTGLLFTAAIVLGRGRSERFRAGWLALGAGGALLLATGAVLWVRVGPTIPEAAALLWALPLLPVILAVPADSRWSTGATRLTLGVSLAATLTLPWAWSERVDARMEGAEQRVERLGTRPDPFLEFLLLRSGEEAIELAETGRNAVEILYGAWIGGGLAEEDVPAWLTVWSPDGLPQEELRIGVTSSRPPMPMDLMTEAIVERRVTLRRYDLADMHYVAVAPLARGAVVSIIVPPRRTLAGPAPLGPLFSPARAEPDPLVLIPLLPGEMPGETEGLNWIRTPDGWQGELSLVYPNEVYHAHYILELPGFVLVVARGTLLLFLSLLPVMALWGVGLRMAGIEGEEGPGQLRAWLASFRGRVTVTLFGFFLIPSLAFGTLAYRTLSGAAMRTAETLAERAVEEGAGSYGEVAGAMDALARRTGSDLLLYAGGELIDGSLQELVDLGLYQGWLPPRLHRTIAAGEDLMATASASLGGWEYVVAYRRIQGGRVIAAPSPLQAGATALRQQEVAHLLGFTVVLGAGLSLLLSLLVGRALTRPIQTLQVASERVGAGNMGVHLPEDRSDEFGAVFGAFNRMVDRLARTRRALVRSSRRTRAIVEEVATGLVALDPSGKVILANPRAEELLATPLPSNRPLPAGGGGRDPLSSLTAWVEAYMRDGIMEAGTDLQLGGRRLRVRARRVSRKGPPGGVVVSLEDVTDELRTERILAWGEMARQVAHEVKNPLTPIQLGIQHVRRAWEDRRPDFGDILDRNVEAILSEIDRLAAIASGFSRYGAPTPPGSRPTEPVDVERAVHEILTLYQAGDGPVTFHVEPLEDVPPVRARTSELKEILVNLLENARAALPSGGTVTVEAERRGAVVDLRVRDDGLGIPEEILPRIFDPHFSTRSGGSGLGLAIVRRLVESWGGRVWAESRMGEETTVTVQVPVWEGTESAGADGTNPSP